MNTLFDKGTLGDIQVNNRVFMAPLTRNRAHSDGTPHERAIAYYTQRASAGLIISEASQISPEGQGYLHTPAVYSINHAKAWSKITSSVHSQGGKIVLQLWHVGRISHRSLLPGGDMPVGPSANRARADTFTHKGVENASDPRALSGWEIKAIIAEYARATTLALDAGFDGVEVHGANGYLLNQFIATNANNRDDHYGGNVENRSRLLLEVIDAVSAQAGSGRVGVRLSPTGTFNDIKDAQVVDAYSYIYSQLDHRNLAYLHVVERFPGYEVSDEDEQLIRRLRSDFVGNYIANGSYDRSSATKAVEEGAFAVAFGRPFIANPDLPERLRNDLTLAEPDQETLYGGDEKGYSDYPRHASAH